MRFRQVHLDFHTGEKVPDVGSRFSKKQFQNALIKGHVDSITLFSKCHHGWAYHPTKANKMHPSLNFDLLGAQIEAAHEIGVKTPVYLSAGFDEKIAREHPDWLVRLDKNDYVLWDKPIYHLICFNSPYLDVLADQVTEAAKNYDADGIFLDIVGVRVCYCQNCVRDMLAAGKDPYDEKNALENAEKVYAKYLRTMREAVDKAKPGLPIFHNAGHISHGRRDLAYANTHFELESLPTGGWGYDHFPMSAAYARTLGREYLGMTGKFHGNWGEFGGFKHPNALRYEVALSAANGAKCSIGDQLHPDGFMDEATYALIGEAYSELEQKEEWLDHVTSVADIAILSAEAIANYYAGMGTIDRDASISGVGATRMLLEGKYLFDIIDTESVFNGDVQKYKLVILPDTIRLDEALTTALKKFVRNGGKVLATGESGLGKDDRFALDFGCEYIGECEYAPTYLVPRFDVSPFEKASFLIREKAYCILPTTENILIDRENPYFNRTPFAFCSHQHTPNDKADRFPAATVGKDGAYIASKLFTEYAVTGSLISKILVHRVLDSLLGDEKTLVTDLPSLGVATLMNQTDKNRLVCHLLYGTPVKRGDGVEVIEDIVPLYNVNVSIKTEEIPKAVYTAPDKAPLPFRYEHGKVTFTVEKLENHAMVVLEL